MLALQLSILALAAVALFRRHDARLVLLAAGTALAATALEPMLPIDTLARAMVASLVAPICASMGFAATLTAAGCDRALTRLLLAPIRRRRWLALPGAAVAAYLVNLAIPSQAATAATVGPVALPLLRAVGLPIELAACAVLLGASFGGDLLSPGAQDLIAVAGAAPVDAVHTGALLRPAGISGLMAAIVVLVLVARRHRRSAPEPMPAPAAEAPLGAGTLVRGLLPLVPTGLLFAAHAGVPGFGWLGAPPSRGGWDGATSSLAVVRAMCVGTALVVAVSWRTLRSTANEFFAGMGQAYGSVIALTICAQVFGAGFAACGLAERLLGLTDAGLHRDLLAAGAPFTLSLASGSGSGSVLSCAQVLLAARPPGADLDRSAALVCLFAAFGRTLSPAAAVVVCVAGLCRLEPMRLVRTTALPVFAGAAAAATAVLAAG